MKYLDILPINYIDYLTYQLPDNIKKMPLPGQKIIIPFGNKNVSGIFIKETKKPAFKTRDITKILNESILTQQQTKILEHLSCYYFCSPAKALKLMHIIDEISKDKKIIENKKDNKFLLIEKNPQKSYEQILKKSVNKDRQILLLFPDIKSIETFKKNSKNQIEKYKYKIFTSLVNKKEKDIITKEVYSGKIKLIIGTRTSLFLPYKNLKTIVIDKEGEDGHRSEETPRYSSIEISELLAKYNNATIVVNTAVQNQELYIKSTQDYKTIDQNKYVTLENILIEEPHYPIIGNVLEAKIERFVSLDKKVAIFINNKGNNGILMCKDCKNILSCGNCNEKLTTDDKTFSCKKCQIEIKKIPRCNKCGGLNIFSPGTTIKKTIKELLAIFPKINIAEVSKNNPNVKNLKNADIIIGTTALKNINFNNFESLIILYPETFINMPGYNSDSKALYTLSILKEKLQNNKKLLIKTSESKNNVIRHLISGKYSNFYKEKSGELKDYGYPPYKDIIRIKIKEKDNKKLLESEIKIKKHLRKYNLISEYEEKNKNYFIKTIIFKSMKNKLFYDTILKSFKNITIERNPNKGI